MTDEEINLLREAMEGEEYPLRKLMQISDELTANERKKKEKDMVAIYDEEALKERLRGMDEGTLHYETLQPLTLTPAKKPYAQVTKDILGDLDELEVKFPNFSELIQEIKLLLRLEFASEQRAIRLPHFLLCGPPGVGKTRLLNELTKVLQLGDLRLVDMATASASFILAGGSTSWKNGKQGVVTRHLQESDVANPMILLDEIDKPLSNDHNPIGALFNLLENFTSTNFIDEALDFPMNCSQIIYFATANSLDSVDDAIKSRFEIVHIESPTQQQMAAITDSVYQEMRAESSWGCRFSEHLADEVVVKLQACSPRAVRRLLKKACANALDRVVEQGISDDVITLAAEDIVHTENNNSRTGNIGFY